MEALKVAMIEVVAEIQPATCRQVFYQLVSRGIVDKDEAAYKGTVVRLLTELRVTERIPFGWIADNTRWMRKPQSFANAQSALRRTAATYRRSIWDSQEAYVEIWIEKDALAGVAYDVTSEWDVPLMVTRGYPSISFLYEAADVMNNVDGGRTCYLYYFGDRDPSGTDIPRAIEARLREFAPSAMIEFHRMAVTREQIALFNLPTRPTKKSDSRAKAFDGESVELDAIPPADLKAIIRDCIEQHIDQRVLEQTRLVEAAERDTLMAMNKSLQEAGGAWGVRP